MFTYIAEGVLEDYTAGMVVVHAEGIKKAREIVSKQFSEETATDINSKLRRIKKNELVHVYGGG